MSVPSRPGDRSPSPSVSVVIPVPVTERLPLLFAGLPPVHEVIVVVGPGEDTVLALPRPARVIRQTRQGVGNAVACGVAAATGDVVVTLPGDASCDPAELPRLVEALHTGADAAEGIRYRPAPPSPPSPTGPLAEADPVPPNGPLPTADLLLPAWPMPAGGPPPPTGSLRPASPLSAVGRLSPSGPLSSGECSEAGRARYGDLILLWFMSVLFGCRPADPGSGFRAFRRDRADRLGLPRVAGTETARGDGRDGEPLFTVRSRAAGLRVAEVPVTSLRRPGGGPTLIILSALAREYLARYRDARAARATRAAAAESIVVLTGGHLTPGSPDPDSPFPAPDSPFQAPDSPRRATGAVNEEPTRPQIDPLRIHPPRITPSEATPPRINPPRTPLPDQHLTYVQGRRWPSPNRAVAVNHPGRGNFHHPNSSGLGFPGRRRGEHGGPEHRRTGSVPGTGTGGRGPAIPAGRQGDDCPLGEVTNRRRWRDDHGDTDNGRPRTQDRPNLRVINGEGGGSGGGRGHLRPVPRPDQL